MSASIKTLLTPRESDIGNLVVRRVLPARAARLVGPFIFFDEMGPAVLPAGSGIDVLPHPHIGLATVTYLFDGTLMHHDSLGFRQKIVPGDVSPNAVPAITRTLAPSRVNDGSVSAA